jgi:hypothetical protein
MTRWVFEVHYFWKGDPPDTITVYSARKGVSCGYEFQLDKRYIVYARLVDTPRIPTMWPDDAEFPALSTSKCSRTAGIAAASEDLRLLPPPTYHSATLPER